MGHVRRLIVFDLDGTLVDSRRDLADAANALILERGGRPLSLDAVVDMVGEGAALLVGRALGAAGLPLDDRSLPRFLELYDERLLRTTRPYEGVREALETLSRAAVVAVLTNKPLTPARAVLEGLGLAPWVSQVIGGDGAFPRKPDPAGLQHLVAAYQAEGRTVFVGDSRIDHRTARSAGVAFCLARYGFGHRAFPTPELPDADLVVAAAAELPGVLLGQVS